MWSQVIILIRFGHEYFVIMIVLFICKGQNLAHVITYVNVKAKHVKFWSITQPPNYLKKVGPQNVLPACFGWRILK